MRLFMAFRLTRIRKQTSQTTNLVFILVLLRGQNVYNIIKQLCGVFLLCKVLFDILYKIIFVHQQSQQNKCFSAGKRAPLSLYWDGATLLWLSMSRWPPTCGLKDCQCEQTCCRKAKCLRSELSVSLNLGRIFKCYNKSRCIWLAELLESSQTYCRTQIQRHYFMFLIYHLYIELIH